MKNYKEMVYSHDLENCIVLAQDFYKEYEFFVINLGNHPCCYVRLKSRKYDNYDDYNKKINVHGGFTYLETFLYTDEQEYIIDDNGFLGWDYAHYGDYTVGFNYKSLKKWTTEEMVAECKHVIDQLIKMEDYKK